MEEQEEYGVCSGDGPSSGQLHEAVPGHRRLGQRQTFVSKFELGEWRLDVAEFVLVSRALGADPHEIIREAEAADADE